jgi:hypothetical protein
VELLRGAEVDRWESEGWEEEVRLGGAVCWACRKMRGSSSQHECRQPVMRLRLFDSYIWNDESVRIRIDNMCIGLVSREARSQTSA